MSCAVSGENFSFSFWWWNLGYSCWYDFSHLEARWKVSKTAEFQQFRTLAYNPKWSTRLQILSTLRRNEKGWKRGQRTRKNTWKVTKTAQGGATTTASLLFTLTSFLAVKASKAANCVLQDPLEAEERPVLLPSICLRQLLFWPVSRDLDQNIKEQWLYILRCASLKAEHTLPFFSPH